MSLIPIYFILCCFIQNLHVHKAHLFLEMLVYTKFACSEKQLIVVFWVYTRFACPENKFMFGILVLYQIRMSIIHIYFLFFGFIPNLHVQKAHLFFDFWVYTTFACPENQFIFGILGLYQICMAIKPMYFCFFGCIPILHTHNTNLFLECWVYTKFACPEYICLRGESCFYTTFACP